MREEWNKGKGGEGGMKEEGRGRNGRREEGRKRGWRN